MRRRDSKYVKVYLDQKDWINLARADYNRPDGQRYKVVLQKVLEIVENKKAIFPLSFTHVIETNKRRDLGNVKADTILLNAQFLFAPDTSMPAAAQATVDAAGQLYGHGRAMVVKSIFEARGILP